jgi:hypothetical protein
MAWFLADFNKVFDRFSLKLGLWQFTHLFQQLLVLPSGKALLGQ